jgi:hypothetical protein
LAFSLGRELWQTPAARQYQQLDLWKSAILDYGIYQPRLKTAADTLAFAAIGHWWLADQQVLNAGFYQQHGRIDAAYIVGQVAPQKAAALLLTLVRDHFFVLLVNALLFGWLWTARVPGRQLLIGYGIYFWLLMLAIGLVLKLPPRVLTPCLSLYTLAQLLWWPGRGGMPFPTWFKLALVVTSMAAIGYLAKLAHRTARQQQRQQTNEQFIAQVARLSRGRVLVYSVLPDYFRSLSPLRNYTFGATALFPLTGWSTLDPGYAGFYQSRTGRRDFVAAVLALNRQQNTLWLLEPGFARILTAYLQAYHGAALHLVPQPGLLKPYRVEVWTPAIK